VASTVISVTDLFQLFLSFFIGSKLGNTEQWNDDGLQRLAQIISVSPQANTTARRDATFNDKTPAQYIHIKSTTQELKLPA